MCAEIVNLDDIVGGDLTFMYGGKELKIPGDISTKKVFEIFNAFRELSDVQEDGDPEKIQAANDLINAQLLKLFQIREPEMDELPFGIKTMPIVIQEILKLLGVNVRDEEEGGGNVVPLTRSTPKRKKASTTRKRPAAGR